jgi:hypothetical protein
MEEVRRNLLDEIVHAHGGNQLFSMFRRAQGKFHIHGDLWSSRGGPTASVGGQFELGLRDQTVRLLCTEPRRIESNFTPKVLAIDSVEGGFVETQYNPRSSFAEKQIDRPWDDFQLAYICSYSIWNVVTQPFLFASAGFEVLELQPHEVGKETIRRLEISYPPHVPGHAPKIVCHVGADGIMRWQEFRFDLLNASVTSVLKDFVHVQGIRFASRRTMYRSTELEKSDPSVFAEISIDKLVFY